MAAHRAPTPEPAPTAEVPLLAVFAVLIILAVVAIGFVIAMPSTGTLLLAIGTVIGFAVLVTWMLARMIGPEA